MVRRSRPLHGETVFEYVVDVGFTTRRPVVPDQHMSRVTVLADSDNDAICTAFAMVYGRAGVVMVTSTTILSVVL